MPVLNDHSADIVAVQRRILEDIAQNQKVREAVRRNLTRVIDDPEFRAIVWQIFREVLVDNPRLHQRARTALETAEARAAVQLAADYVEPCVRRIGDLLLGTREDGIAPEFAQVLRNQILDKDCRWLVLEHAPGLGADQGRHPPHGPARPLGRLSRRESVRRSVAGSEVMANVDRKTCSDEQRRRRPRLTSRERDGAGRPADSVGGHVASLRGGQVTLIVGRSGVGKTTLLKAIAGLIDEREEGIRVSGRCALCDRTGHPTTGSGDRSASSSRTSHCLTNSHRCRTFVWPARTDRESSSDASSLPRVCWTNWECRPMCGPLP